jgi:hypothetical protein
MVQKEEVMDEKKFHEIIQLSNSINSLQKKSRLLQGLNIYFSQRLCPLRWREVGG